MARCTCNCNVAVRRGLQSHLQSSAGFAESVNSLQCGRNLNRPRKRTFVTQISEASLFSRAALDGRSTFVQWALYLFRPGRCVKADPAADLAALNALGFRSVFEAALAAFLLVTSLLRTCVRADPAADFAALLAVRLLSVLLAADAARLPVDSDCVLLGIARVPRDCW